MDKKLMRASSENEEERKEYCKANHYSFNDESISNTMASSSIFVKKNILCPVFAQANPTRRRRTPTSAHSSVILLPAKLTTTEKKSPPLPADPQPPAPDQAGELPIYSPPPTSSAPRAMRR